MEKIENELQRGKSVPDALENPMQTARPVETPRVNRSAPPDSCAHGRMIEDVLTKDGRRTGKVRCVECGKVIDDPYLGMR